MRHALVLSMSTFHWLSNKHDGINTRKCKNSKMYIITKCILGYITIWNLYSLPLNKTAQQHSQHCLKLHNEVHNVLHNKIYQKVEFPLWFGFIKQVKNKVCILNWVFKLLFIKSATQLLCTFCCPFCCTKCLYILLESVCFISPWLFVSKHSTVSYTLKYISSM